VRAGGAHHARIGAHTPIGGYMSEEEEECEVEFEFPPAIHRAIYEFGDYMAQWYYRDTNGERVFDPSQMIGYEAMERAESYAKTHPDDIHLVYCDDDVFNTSLLVLVRHEDAEEYWGTTVFYIPQTSTTTNTFFLYPSHATDLRNSLRRLKKR
jgi:hypothetical protein